jgi:hypothetical protein
MSPCCCPGGWKQSRGAKGGLCGWSAQGPSRHEPRRHRRRPWSLGQRGWGGAVSLIVLPCMVTAGHKGCSNPNRLISLLSGSPGL